jgi:hypothetical protein
MSLRERCTEILTQLRANDIVRQGNRNLDELMAFVIAEKGRAADISLEDTKPLCLYFANEADREEFLALAHEAKPNMISKKMPCPLNHLPRPRKSPSPPQ